MSISAIKKVNTLGVTYPKGGIRDHHYEEILENIMGIPEDEICGIDGRGRDRFIFQVTTHQRYADICREFTCRDIFLEQGHVIRVDDISTEGTIVEITRVPFEVTNDMLTQILENFGDVAKCQTYHRKYGKYTKCTNSGFRMAWVKIKSPIPKTVYIKQIDNYINISYHNQPFTCNTCGVVGHSFRRCKVKPDKYKNVIDLNVIKTSVKIDCSVCDYSCPYESLLVDHMKCHTGDKSDVHFDPSQNTKKFNCPDCEYSCDYENILTIHMECHTEEKSFSCTECSFKCKSEDILKQHLISHNIYACDNCKFRGKSKIQLDDHSNKHNGNLYKCNGCEYTCKTATELKEHICIHSGEHVDLMSHGIAFSPGRNSTSLLNNGKRGLSVSPEIQEINKISLRSNTNNLPKKSKP